MLKVGLALYTIRDKMNANPIEAIERVGKLGYKYVEAANYALDNNALLGFDITPEAFKAKLDEFGMKLVSCHIGRADLYEDAGSSMIQLKETPRILDLTEEDIKRCSEAHLKVGNDKLVYPIAFYPNSRDEVMKKCEYFNRLSSIAKSCGTTLVYHAHFQEYALVDGKLIFEYLYDHTDMLFELDTFWVLRSGEDPISMMKRFGDRIILLHQKDFSKDTNVNLNLWTFYGSEMKNGTRPGRYVRNPEFFCIDVPEVFAEIGTGILPVQDYIDAANQYTKAEYILLEQDYSVKYDEYESIEISMNSFKKFNGIQW